MSGMAIFLMTGHSPDKILMTLSMFAIVAVRLMPSLNRISTAWGSIKFYAPTFDAIYDDLVNCERMDDEHQQLDHEESIYFRDKIEIRDVSFFYENTRAPALKSFSIEILRNTTVGFVGPSGAGKSTAVDIMMGLLLPSSGKVLVDGVDIGRHLRSWQKKIGYIPQMIYLCDDTIKSNIAFGVATEDIEDEKVWQVLRLAQLEDFVRSLPLGTDTVIGERGIRLSGGQRQRISIARALYHDPEVLVMDEATAALDNETERDFMAAINRLSSEKTIIIIAHRLTTVQLCDKIFFLKEGHLVAEGKYNELLKDCPQFQGMANAWQA
jgi:ATP-binding cassette subfamily C protein